MLTLVATCSGILLHVCDNKEESLIVVVWLHLARLSTLLDNPGDSRFWTMSYGLQIKVFFSPAYNCLSLLFFSFSFFFWLHFPTIKSRIFCVAWAILLLIFWVPETRKSPVCYCNISWKSSRDTTSCEALCCCCLGSHILNIWRRGRLTALLGVILLDEINITIAAVFCDTHTIIENHTLNWPKFSQKEVQKCSTCYYFKTIQIKLQQILSFLCKQLYSRPTLYWKKMQKVSIIKWLSWRTEVDGLWPLIMKMILSLQRCDLVVN